MGDEDLLWSKILADENKQRVITGLQKEQNIGEKWPEANRSAAVLVPLVMAEGVPSVLFTVRSQHISRYRSQVR